MLYSIVDTLISMYGGANPPPPPPHCVLISNCLLYNTKLGIECVPHWLKGWSLQKGPYLEVWRESLMNPIILYVGVACVAHIVLAIRCKQSHRYGMDSCNSHSLGHWVTESICTITACYPCITSLWVQHVLESPSLLKCRSFSTAYKMHHSSIIPIMGYYINE